MSQFFRNLKTAQKLALGFGLCLLFAAIVGGVSLSKMAVMNADAALLNTDSVAGLKALQALSNDVKEFRLYQCREVIATDSAEMNELEAQEVKYQGESEQDLKDYISSAIQPEDQANASKLKSYWNQYLTHTEDIKRVARSNDDKAGGKIINVTTVPDFNAVSDQLDAMADWNSKRAADLSSSASQAYANARIVVIALLIAAIVLGCIIALSITRYMTGVLRQVSGRLDSIGSICVTNLSRAVEALADGDLTCSITTATEPLKIESRDEFGKMGKSFDFMLEKIQATIGSFRQSQASLSALVGELKQSSAQVAAASGTLAAVSAQVGAATEEITATMSEVSSASEQSARGASEIAQGSGTQAIALSESTEQVKQLADAVGSVARDAAGAGAVAEKTDAAATLGSKAVSETVAGMKRIQKTVTETATVIEELGLASAKIGVIVTTIDEIAGQTNLLALNAAIEAARAGDAGKGFAVVADEVRKLAERSSSATKEIADVIGQVQSRTAQAVSAIEVGTKDVATGTALAEQAGSALQDIQRLVADLSRQVQGIGSAAEEMAASADEVTRSITEVAAVVEEASAAAEEMSASAEQVSASIQTVTGTTAQQSASVEELVASAEDLSGVAQTLDETIARFKVDAAPAASSTSSTGKPRLKLLKAA